VTAATDPDVPIEREVTVVLSLSLAAPPSGRESGRPSNPSETPDNGPSTSRGDRSTPSSAIVGGVAEAATDGRSRRRFLLTVGAGVVGSSIVGRSVTGEHGSALEDQLATARDDREVPKSRGRPPGRGRTDGTQAWMEPFSNDQYYGTVARLHEGIDQHRHPARERTTSTAMISTSSTGSTGFASPRSASGTPSISTSQRGAEGGSRGDGHTGGPGRCPPRRGHTLTPPPGSRGVYWNRRSAALRGGDGPGGGR